MPSEPAQRSLFCPIFPRIAGQYDDSKDILARSTEIGKVSPYEHGKTGGLVLGPIPIERTQIKGALFIVSNDDVQGAI